MKPKLILAPLDFSTPYSTALQHAARLVLSFAAQLHVLHVTTTGVLAAAVSRRGEAYESVKRHALAHTRNAFCQTVASVPARITIHTVALEHRNAAEGLAEQASTSHADLLVISSVGHTDLRYLLLGSTPERLLYGTPCSILLVKLVDQSV